MAREYTVLEALGGDAGKQRAQVRHLNDANALLRQQNELLIQQNQILHTETRLGPKA